MCPGCSGRSVLAAGMLTAWAGPAHAQAIGSIFGKVTDASGGVLPGVTVTVTGTGLQQPLVATTSESGTYQFPSVPIGTYTVTFELSSFKKAVRPNVVITTGFNAGIDQKLEIGQMSEEVTVSSASPVVDTKKTTTGAMFTSDILEKIPTARDPWQIVNMTPGVQLTGYNVGGSASGQQLTPSVRGSTANVQWNLEGGSITDLSSNSSSIYFNFDSFDQIQVTTGGGDVSVQSSGLAINLVTKSGSNVFKGTFNGTFENDKMQSDNVTEELFNAGANGFLSGNPLKKIANYSIEAGGPIKKDKLWYWGAVDRQDINVGVTNFFDASLGSFCQDLITAQKKQPARRRDHLRQPRTGAEVPEQRPDADQGHPVEGQLPAQRGRNKLGYIFLSNDKIRNAPRRQLDDAAGSDARAVQRHAVGLRQPDAPDPAHVDRVGQAGVQQPGRPTSAAASSSTTRIATRAATAATSGSDRPRELCDRARARRRDCLWNIQSLNNRTTGVNSRALRRLVPDGPSRPGTRRPTAPTS